MLSERRDPPSDRFSRERFAGFLNRVLPKPSQFSNVTAAIAGALFLSTGIDFFIGHTQVDRLGVALWALFFLLLGLMPVVLGRRFPYWTGLLVVGLLTVWGGYFVFFAIHSHMELDAILLSPVLGLYLGWYFRPGVARIALALHLLVISLAFLLRPVGDQFPFSSNLALVYAILVAGLCLETAAAVRANAEWESWRDPLTGVLNRRGLVKLGKRAITRAQATGAPLSFVVVDLDDFKTVNDTGGHAEGDRALRVVSANWVEKLQPEDLVARTGGDEFILVIHEREGDVREQLTALAAGSEFAWSWGITQLAPGDTFDDVVMRADAELYVQKRLRHGQ